MHVVDSADSGFHDALLVGVLGRLALAVERAARQARYVQHVRQLIVMPQPAIRRALSAQLTCSTGSRPAFF